MRSNKSLYPSPQTGPDSAAFPSAACPVMKIFYLLTPFLLYQILSPLSISLWSSVVEWDSTVIIHKEETNSEDRYQSGRWVVRAIRASCTSLFRSTK